jgi:hypothetical protein
MDQNIALIILDTVRQDYFAKHATCLRSMSDVVFAQCRAASSCSVPSHASILTGELPHQHGIYSESVDYSQLDEESTFFGELENHRTVGVSTNTFAGEPFGFDELFDEFVDVSWTRRVPKGMDAREFVSINDASGLSFYTEFLKTALRHEHPLATLSNGALAQLDLLFSRLPVPKLFDDGGSAALRTAERRIGTGDEPFFLFINLMEAHTPHQPTRVYDRSLYDTPADWSSTEGLNQWEINRNNPQGHETEIEHFRQLYAAAVDYLDRKVSGFIESVQAATAHETTFIITADHGENLGYPADDTMMGHTSSLSEGLLHVPLVLVNPPHGYSTVEHEYVSQTELGRLISGLSAGQTPEVTADRIAAERITTTNVPDVESEERRYWKRMLRCVYDNERKWTWDSLGESGVYRLDNQRSNWQERMPDEEPSRPEWADEFFIQDIGEFGRHSNGTDVAINDATRSRLEELGYL